MTDESKHSDNIGTEEQPVRRRPGRPKGLPKPPGSGRQKGTPNKVGRDARELADKYTPQAFATLGKLLANPDPKVQAIAAQQILDRRFGKPVSPQEISGPDGTPLHPPAEQMDDRELGYLVAFMLARTAQEKLPRGTVRPQTSDGMRRVLEGEPWSPDEPEEVEARAKLYGPSWAERAEPDAARRSLPGRKARSGDEYYDPRFSMTEAERREELEYRRSCEQDGDFQDASRRNVVVHLNNPNRS